MRRFIPLFVIVAVLLVAILVYRSFAGGGSAAAGPGGGPPGGMPPTAVETVRVQLQDVPNQFETIGTLRADESIVVRPETAGRIAKINFIEGEQVAAGTLLFTMDDALTRADLNEANANLHNSQRAFARAKELSAKQLIARADLDTRQAELAVTQARAASARTRMDKTQIRAPFAGVTGLRNVSQGDYVTAGQELVSLVRLDPIELDLRAPEVVLSSLAVGQDVEFGVATFPSERFSAKVVAIAPTVDAGGRSVALRARLENPERKLRPGMSARVKITTENHQRALLVPEQAIWPQGEQKMVFVVVGGVAKLVPVTLGVRQPGTVEVTSGLKAGDEIVVTGQLKLFDGSKVAVKPASADSVSGEASSDPSVGSIADKGQSNPAKPIAD